MIVGILGFIGSGKGTVAEYLVKEHNFRQDSFAASVKDVCSVMFDWPRNLMEGDTEESREWRNVVDPWWSEKLNIPEFTPRYAMQHIGTDAIRDHFSPDIWFLTVENRMRKSPNRDVVISDARFPNEIEFIRKNNGILLQVNRGPQPIWYETAILANKGNSVAQEVMRKGYPDAHYSEWAWVGTKVDYEIDNNGTLEDLQSGILTAISNKI